MSMGFGGWCHIVEQDENTVIYEYGSYNLNDPKHYNEIHLSDGIFVIDKNSLVEPYVYEKIKRLPNGKKKYIVKRIFVDVPYTELYESGKIEIQNCSNCWKTTADDIDVIAWKLIREVFKIYQENWQLPEGSSINV